mgnify:CR=1 FL=1
MYETWQRYKVETLGQNLIFPCGVGAVLYPPHSLDFLVVKKEDFLKLCLLADDVRFWFCGMLKRTPKYVIYKNCSDYSFDALYQYFYKGSA